MEKKKLVVNTSICDARNVTEATLESYSSVTINAAAILCSPASRELMARYDITMNAASVEDVPADAVFSSKNGSFTIGPGEPPAYSTALNVNGRLFIEPGSGPALSGYVSISVNGQVLIPASLAGESARIRCNGSVSYYPDEAVRLDGCFAPDRTFLLRARNALYWAEDKVVLLDPAADPAALAAKGVRFDTGALLVTEGMAEAALPMFRENVKVTIVPDGAAYVDDGATLTASLLRRKGARLYVDGDLTVNEDGGGLLDALEYLNVNGTAFVPGALEERFVERGFICGELVIVRGLVISDKPSVTVSAELLRKNPGGVTVSDCARVVIADDVTPQLLEDRLSISDCATVRCPPELLERVELLCEDVVSISAKKDEPAGLFDGLKKLGAELRDTKVVNCASYVL